MSPAILRSVHGGWRAVLGLSLVNTAKALYLALLYQATGKHIFVIVDGNKQAETLLESAEVFFGPSVCQKPQRPLKLLGSTLAPRHSAEIVSRRLSIWKRAENFQVRVSAGIRHSGVIRVTDQQWDHD